MHIQKHQKGFTIVELLVATAVFSAVLLGAAATIIQITRLYYKGIVTTRNQTAARNLVESITAPIQLSNETIIQPTIVNVPYMTAPYKQNVLCLGTTRISYVIGLQTDSDVAIDMNDGVTKIRHAVWQDQVDAPQNCTANPPDLTQQAPVGVDGKDLLGQHMRLTQLDVTLVTPSNSIPIAKGLWSINVSVVYGDRDLITPGIGDADQYAWDKFLCNGVVAGSQWCARTSYATFVFKRITDVTAPNTP